MVFRIPSLPMTPRGLVNIDGWYIRHTAKKTHFQSAPWSFLHCISFFLRMLVVTYMAFVLSLFVSHLSLFWCNFVLQNCGFVDDEVLRPSQPTGVMSSAVSFPNHTFTGQA